MTTECNNAKAKASELAQECEKLTNRAGDSREEDAGILAGKSGGKISELQQLCDDRERELQQAHEKEKALQAKVEELEAILAADDGGKDDTVEGERRLWERERAILEQDVAALRTQNGTLISERQVLVDKTMDTQNMLSRSEESLRLAEKELQSFKIDRSAAHTQLGTIKGELAAAKLEKAEQADTIMRLENANARLREDYDKLHKRLDEALQQQTRDAVELQVCVRVYVFICAYIYIYIYIYT